MHTLRDPPSSRFADKAAKAAAGKGSGVSPGAPKGKVGVLVRPLNLGLQARMKERDETGEWR